MNDSWIGPIVIIFLILLMIVGFEAVYYLGKRESRTE
jgi:ABC-type multidrug transport system permease subunit